MVDTRSAVIYIIVGTLAYMDIVNQKNYVFPQI